MNHAAAAWAHEGGVSETGQVGGLTFVWLRHPVSSCEAGHKQRGSDRWVMKGNMAACWPPSPAWLCKSQTELRQEDRGEAQRLQPSSDLQCRTDPALFVTCDDAIRGARDGHGARCRVPTEQTVNLLSPKHGHPNHMWLLDSTCILLCFGSL